MAIMHFETCNANYPEKVEGETAQQEQIVPLDNDQEIAQCVDCGAFEIRSTK